MRVTVTEHCDNVCARQLNCVCNCCDFAIRSGFPFPYVKAVFKQIPYGIGLLFMPQEVVLTFCNVKVCGYLKAVIMCLCFRL